MSAWLQRFNVRVGGINLVFHFDPIVYYPGWENDYREVVKELFAAVKPANVAWISLGALRFYPSFAGFRPWPISEVQNTIWRIVPGHHGKLRYFRPIREEIYRKMKLWIHDEAPQVLVYICMESCLVWQNSMDDALRDAAQLSDLLDKAVRPQSENRRQPANCLKH